MSLKKAERERVSRMSPKELYEAVRKVYDSPREEKLIYGELKRRLETAEQHYETFDAIHGTTRGL